MIMTYDEYTYKVYLDGNDEEEEIRLFLREDKFEIYGAIRTIDKKDFYVTLYLNARVVNCVLNPDPIIARISLKGPYYIQYDRKLTRKERDIFVEYMSNNWNHVLETLSGIYKIFNKVVEYNGSCPDYTQLEVID